MLSIVTIVPCIFDCSKLKYTVVAIDPALCTILLNMHGRNLAGKTLWSRYANLEYILYLPIVLFCINRQIASNDFVQTRKLGLGLRGW